MARSGGIYEKQIIIYSPSYGCFLPFAFYLFTCLSGRRPKRRPPIIGRTCAFDAKIYKNVDTIFDVSPCVVWNKKIFKFFYFCFQLPSLLVEFLDKILPILTATEDTKEITQTQINAD